MSGKLRTILSKLNLRPFAQLPEGIPSYLDYNFTRIENVLDQSKDVWAGTSLVTGALTLATGLTVVSNVFVSFLDPPVAGACFAYGVPVSGSTGTITLRVLDNAFVQSTLAKQIQWLAVGTLVL